VRHVAAEPVAPLRVSVQAGRRRADLALPPTIPVAELVPDLVSTLGVLEAAVLGVTLALPSGRGLSDQDSLADQGVADGAVLCLVTGRPEPPVVHDDAAEAVLELDRPEACRDASRSALLVAAGLWLGGLWLAGLTWPTSVTRLVLPGCAALVLVAGAAALARAWPAAALLLAWSACAFAGLAGCRAVEAPRFLGAGLAVALTGLLAVAALEARRRWLLPPVSAGVLLGAVGGAQAAAIPVGAAASVGLVLCAAVPSVFPRLTALVLDPGDRVLDAITVTELADNASRLTDAMTVAATGASLVMVVFLVPIGWPSVPILVVAGALLLLRDRGSTVQRVAGIAGGSLMLLLACATAAGPGGHREAMSLCAAGAALALLAGATSHGWSAGARRARDRVEVVAVAALPPLALLSSGALQWIT